MSASGGLEVVAFALSSLLAIAGALGMATTMSMFRSAIFLMASFLGVAALFILLAADLLGLLQVMMYIGGMLVMALFMVLFMPDPGGAMMAAMPGLKGPERWFSLGLAPRRPAPSAGGSTEEHSHNCTHGHAHAHAHTSPDQDKQAAVPAHASSQSDDHKEEHRTMAVSETHQMDISDMSMVTPIRPVAVWLTAAIGCALVALLLLHPAWPVSPAAPDPHSAKRIGLLLMGKYMVGFEAAGFLILIGIMGAVLTAHPDRHPDRQGRDERVAMDSPPPPIEPDRVPPLAPARRRPD